MHDDDGNDDDDGDDNNNDGDDGNDGDDPVARSGDNFVLYAWATSELASLGEKNDQWNFKPET